MGSCALLLAAPVSAAADFTWSGAAPTGTGLGPLYWSNGANWVGGTAPSGSVGTLDFPQLTSSACTANPPTDTCYATHNDISGLAVNQLAIDDLLGDGYSLTGDGLTLGAGGLTASPSGTPVAGEFGAAAVFLPITLGATQTWSINGGSGNPSLAILGGVSGAGAGLTVNLNRPTPMFPGGELDLSGDIEVGNVDLGGTGGTLFLGDPSFTGSLNATDGNTVTVSNHALLDASANTASAGALTVDGSLGVGDDAETTPAGSLSAVSATFNSESSLAFGIVDTGTVAGTDYGQLRSAGAVNLAGANLSISSDTFSQGQLTGCLGLPFGQVYTLISTTGTLTGTFANVSNGGFIADSCNGSTTDYRINYNETGSPETVTATVSSFTWTGGGGAGSPNWSTGANWSGGNPPSASSSIGLLTFPSNGPSNYAAHNDVVGLTVNQLRLDDMDGYDLTGDGITLGAGGLVSLVGGTRGSNATVGLPITLGASQSWDMETSGTVVLTGGLSGSTDALSVFLNNQETLDLSGDNEVGSFTLTGAPNSDETLNLSNGAQLNATDGSSVAINNATLDSAGGSVGALTTTADQVQVGASFTTPAGSLATTSTTLDSNSAVTFEIPGAGTMAGSDYGQLTSSGSIDLSSAALQIDTDDFGGCAVPSAGTVYMLVSATGGLSGTFGEVPDGSSIGDNCDHAVRFQINYTAHTVTATVQPTTTAAPSLITPPLIYGTAQQGQTLTLTQGSWSNNPTSINDQWQDCDSAGNNCTAIAGATGQTYTLASADVGHTIVMQETASNAGGISTPANSGPTGAVSPAKPQDLSAPLISGSAQQGQTLTLTQGSWSNNPTGIADQWQDCDSSGDSCTAIAGATGQTYTLTSSDVGHTIRAQEIASNAGGSSPATSSAATVVVQVPPGRPGTFTRGVVKVTGLSATVPSSCAGGPGATCTMMFTLSITELVKRGAVIGVIAKKSKTTKKVVRLGTATVILSAGQTKTVVVTLNATGRRLLAKHHTLKVKLAITESGKAISSTTVAFKAKATRTQKR